MLKILLRLWWLQQRRNFTWKDALVGGYIVLLYVIVGVSFYFGSTLEGDALLKNGVPSVLCASLVLGMLVPDMILKIPMKRDCTAMDDYIKSRPVPEKVWNRFLLLTNLVSFWNYVVPVLMLPMLFWLLSVSQALMAFVLMLVYSYINGIYITCYRKTTEWMLRWPLVVGWFGMGAVLTAYLFLFAWMPAAMLIVGMLVWAVLILAGLVAYLYHLKIYNESRHKVSRFHSFSNMNLFSLQYVGLLRAKRVRNMVLIMVVIFFADSLLMALMPSVDGNATTSPVIYVVGDVILPSLVLSQWTFGIEANFFQGLMTKPIRVAQLLRNCYYFYLSISAVMTVLTIAFVLISPEVHLTTLLGAYAMAIIINLFNLPTCLFSSRLEIFSNSMFNMQGANMKINLYSIAFLVPLAAVAGIYYLWGELVWCLVCVALAAVCLLAHRRVIAWVAACYERRRYERMEKYME